MYPSRTILSRSNVSLVLIAVLLVGLVAAACGRDSEPEVQPAAAQSAEPTAAPADVPAAAPVETDTEAPAGPAATELQSEEPEVQQADLPVATRSSRTGDEELAPELRDITGWINSEPFTLKDQRGKVVLVDFYTWTCVNCIRTFPYLKDWHMKYEDRGLVIVGVQAYEFEFEKKRENIAAAAEEAGLEYPIAIDNNRVTWEAYANRYWPAKYLIDQDGYIRYTHFGEGQYEETELIIRELLTEAGAQVSDIPLGEVVLPEYEPLALSRDPMNSITRELYAGVARNYGALRSGSAPPYVSHEEFYLEPDAEIEYEDPGDHNNHFIYLQGLWRNDVENLTHARETENFEDYIAIKFYATTVNLVMGGENLPPYEVRVTLNDKALDPAEAGADVRFDADGNSFVVVDESKMYRLVSIPMFGGHELKLSSNSSDFSAFAFTFGGFKPQSES